MLKDILGKKDELSHTEWIFSLPYKLSTPNDCGDAFWSYSPF